MLRKEKEKTNVKLGVLMDGRKVGNFSKDQLADKKQKNKNETETTNDRKMEEKKKKKKKKSQISYLC